MDKTIYLDNAATSFPKPESVYCSMDRINRTLGANPSRTSHKMAGEAQGIVEKARDGILEFLHANHNASLVFSPSVTIAINQLLHGLSFESSDVIYVTPYESSAMITTLENLKNQHHFKIRMIPVEDKTGRIDLDDMKMMFANENPTLVCATYLSSSTGYILPVDAIFAEAHSYDAKTILDATQAVGLLDIRLQDSSVDFVAFTGHIHLCGPMGSAGFINQFGRELKTYIHGGNVPVLAQERMVYRSKHREFSGCNISSIGGLQAALDETNLSSITGHVKELTEYLIEKMEYIKEVVTYVPADKNARISVVSFNLNGFMAKELSQILDCEYQIAVSSGYLCNPYLDLLYDVKDHGGVVRVGIGRYNTKEDMDCLISALETIVHYGKKELCPIVNETSFPK